MANHAYGLFELAAIHLSQQPPQLDQARLAVDALAALVEGLAGRLGEAEPSLHDALAQIRLAFVQISEVLEAADRTPAAGRTEPAGPVRATRRPRRVRVAGDGARRAPRRAQVAGGHRRTPPGVPTSTSASRRRSPCSGTGSCRPSSPRTDAEPRGSSNSVTTPILGARGPPTGLRHASSRLNGRSWRAAAR